MHLYREIKDSFVLLILFGSVMFSCAYHKIESDPAPENKSTATTTSTNVQSNTDTTKGTTTGTTSVNPSLVGCDTLNISYSNTIQPIFHKACYSCHGTNNTQSLYDLEDFQSLNNYLVGTTSSGVKGNNFYHDLSTGYMPLNSDPLTACELKKIHIWLQNGGLNN